MRGRLKRTVAALLGDVSTQYPEVVAVLWATARCEQQSNNSRAVTTTIETLRRDSAKNWQRSGLALRRKARKFGCCSHTTG